MYSCFEGKKMASVKGNENNIINPITTTTLSNIIGKISLSFK
jgi:hypothetical protein